MTNFGMQMNPFMGGGWNPWMQQGRPSPVSIGQDYDPWRMFLGGLMRQGENLMGKFGQGVGGFVTGGPPGALMGVMQPQNEFSTTHGSSMANYGSPYASNDYNAFLGINNPSYNQQSYPWTLPGGMGMFSGLGVG